MQIVINISEDDYKEIQNGIAVAYILRKGEIVVLPKGHGRLIDADVVDEKMGNLDGFGFIGRCIDEIPTVLEADKESADDSN